MNTYKVTAGNDESSQKEIGHVESWNLDSAIGSAQFHFYSELSRSRYWEVRLVPNPRMGGFVITTEKYSREWEVIAPDGRTIAKKFPRGKKNGSRYNYNDPTEPKNWIAQQVSSGASKED